MTPTPHQQDSSIDIEALRKAAEAATAGPWFVSKYCSVMDKYHVEVVSSDASSEDRAYIAAANPTIIIALLDRLERAEAAAGAVPEGWRETLEAARHYIDGLSAENGYGFARPANPHDFHPDADSCSEEEIAAHRAACEAYDKGEYTPEKGSEWVGNMHILRAPWGIGSYTFRDPHADKLLAELDKLIAAAPPAQGLPAAPDVPLEIDPRSKRYSADFISGFNMCRREVLSLAKVARPPAAAPSEPVASSDLVFRSRVADLLHLLEYASISTPTWADEGRARKAMDDIRARLATPPAQDAGTADAEIQRLQRALAFWLPTVPEGPAEIADRVANDAMLLCGYEGEAERSAEELGWLRLDYTARYRHLRNLHVEQTNLPGQPCIAMPTSDREGDFYTEEDADRIIDSAIANSGRTE